MRTTTRTIVRGGVRLTITTKTPTQIGTRQIVRYVNGQRIVVTIPVYG